MPRRSSVALRFGASAVALGAGVAYTGCGDVLSPASGVWVDSGSDVVVWDNARGGGSSADVSDATTSPDAGEDARTPSLHCGGQDAAYGAPFDLGCTGLYSDWPKRVLGTTVVEYDPGLRSWNDGAESTRWVELPPGSAIDTSDMNEWRFPVGTKFWMENRVDGRRVETRFYWKRGEGAGEWVRATYRWSEDERTAISISGGAENVHGSAYDVPPVTQCDGCHGGRVDKVLGFDAVSLSSSSSHFGGTSPAISALVSRLTAAPPALAVPDDAIGTAAPALAWLHTNCGTSCHNGSPRALGALTGLNLRLDVGESGLGTLQRTGAYRTAVCRPGQRKLEGSVATSRIAPGSAEHSLLFTRSAETKDVTVRMPPIGTSTPDAEGLRLLRAWLESGGLAACRK